MTQSAAQLSSVRSTILPDLDRLNQKVNKHNHVSRDVSRLTTLKSRESFTDVRSGAKTRTINIIG